MMNTLDVIEEIVTKNSTIDFLTFYKYPTQILLQERTDLDTKEEAFVSTALNIRDKYRLPFRDSLMLSFFNEEDVSEKLLIDAMIHNQNNDEINTCDIEEIRNRMKSLPEENLSVNSKINFDGGVEKHLFLLDFHIFPSSNNLLIISDILKLLDLNGYILNSGESYHFISDSFFDLDSLLDLLAKALFFSPIVDRSWIAHQFLERSCSLRVGKKHGIFPTVVKKV